MDRYLETKFKGTYRIMAELDQDTMDFVRDINGIDFEPSFDDFYIKCAHDIKVKHGVGNELSCFVPSFTRGMNILKQIFNDKIEPFNKEIHTNDYVVEQLLKNKILMDCTLCDGEIYFIFKTKMMEYLAPIVGAKTSGANIGAFSVKNLPKETYVIPDSDLKEYKEIVADMQMHIIKKVNQDFIDKYKIEKNRKLKSKELIHKSGYWKEYCKFLKEVK